MEQDQTNNVNFYDIHAPYGQFNNIFTSKFTDKGITYLSNQHYFQSKKFQGTPKQQYVVDAPTPNQAFDRGNQRSVPLRNDWQEVKEEVMRNGLRLKFGQNPDLLELLLSTGNRKLVQHTVNDSYWGDGGDGSGKNRLGVILMQVRQQLRSK